MKTMVSFKRDTNSLTEREFDVCIVGAGISGAWLALHCARSGLSTAIIEKGDFASQTSSSSSKLLHGGVRYLQQFQLGKVRESAIERAHYLYAAAHQSTPVPFAIPTYRDFVRSKFFLRCGMIAYQALCLGENKIIGSAEETLPPVSSVSRKGMNELYDMGDIDHTGAVVFYERHMINSERVVLSILKTASEHGAKVVNYTKANHYLMDGGKVTGLDATDLISNSNLRINAKLVINAAGPWIDSLNGSLTKEATKSSIDGFAVGSHIITRKVSDHAIALTTKHQSNARIDRGGRHIFIIPWRDYSLIGTSYDEIDKPRENLSPETAHVEQLLEAVNEALPKARLTKEDLVSGYSGLYPLRTDNIQSTVYQGSGEYQIIDHSQSDELDGLVTALGAKFTTGRKLSTLTMKLVSKKLNRQADLGKVRLFNANYSSLNQFIGQKTALYSHLLSEKTIRHLISHFGSELDSLMESCAQDTSALKPICEGQCDILGQVDWAVKKEQAETLSDVIFRRTSVGFLGISEAEVAAVAQRMSAILSWSDERLQDEISVNLKKLTLTRETLAAANDFL